MCVKKTLSLEQITSQQLAAKMKHHTHTFKQSAKQSAAASACSGAPMTKAAKAAAVDAVMNERLDARSAEFFEMLSSTKSPILLCCAKTAVFDVLDTVVDDTPANASQECIGWVATRSKAVAERKDNIFL